jgi:hypothetical protein
VFMPGKIIAIYIYIYIEKTKKKEILYSKGASTGKDSEKLLFPSTVRMAE